MRILLLHNRYRPVAPSGENAVVDQESAALSQRGHQVRVFQRHSEDIEGWSRATKATLPARVVWAEDSRKEVIEEIVDFAPDVVHLHNTFPLMSPSVLRACARLRVPVVAHVHNYKLACANGELFRDGKVCHDCLGGSRAPALRHACYRGSRTATAAVVSSGLVHAAAWRQLVSAYVFISESQRRILAPLGLPAERGFVRHNFAAQPEYALLAEAGAKRQQVTFVGRVDRAKGIDVLMQAWDWYRAQRPQSPLHLVIVGAGPMDPEVAHWAHRRDDVRVTGQIPRAEVTTELARSLAAVVPSAWEETFGMVVPEAFGAGTGVIASNHGSFRELVSPDEGALFTPGDPVDLARALEGVESDPVAWVERGARARDTFLGRFGIDARMDQLVSIYRFAIDNPVSTERPGSLEGQRPEAFDAEARR